MHTLTTPYYLIDKTALQRNLDIIDYVREHSGAKVLLALKCFATWSAFDQMRRHIAGTTSSSLDEARLGRRECGGEPHVHSAAYADHEIGEVVAHCDKIIFNSMGQFQRYARVAKGKPMGLPMTPAVSCAGVELAALA